MTLLAVGVVRGASQLGTFAHRHLGNTLIPASDDLSLADAELERLATVTGGVKLLAVGQRTSVVDHYGLTRLGVGGLISGRNSFYVHTHVSLSDYSNRNTTPRVAVS